jgi:hypothetical protein
MIIIRTMNHRKKSHRSRLAAGGDQQGVGAGEVSFAKTSISSYNCKILLY